MPSIDMLPAKGVYTLVVFLSKEACLNVGKLGVQRFPTGHYAYTGSALGRGASSLPRRISRHLRKEKRRLWHIDFLLAHKNVTVIAVLAAQTTRKAECEVNRYIGGEEGARIPITGFGSSDCKQNCRSHLLYLGEENVKPKIINLYARKFGSQYAVLDICQNV